MTFAASRPAGCRGGAGSPPGGLLVIESDLRRHASDGAYCPGPWQTGPADPATGTGRRPGRPSPAGAGGTGGRRAERAERARNGELCLDRSRMTCDH